MQKMVKNFVVLFAFGRIPVELEGPLTEDEALAMVEECRMRTPNLLPCMKVHRAQSPDRASKMIERIQKMNASWVRQNVQIHQNV